MTDENHTRQTDAVVIALSQRFNDFVERYDRDCGANNEWRRTVETTLKSQSDALAEISPAYYRGKWIIGLVALGSIGVAVKAFWNHISWHP